MEAAEQIHASRSDVDAILATAERLLDDEHMTRPTAAVILALAAIHSERLNDRHQLRLVYPPELKGVGQARADAAR